MPYQLAMTFLYFSLILSSYLRSTKNSLLMGLKSSDEGSRVRGKKHSTVYDRSRVMHEESSIRFNFYGFRISEWVKKRSMTMEMKAGYLQGPEPRGLAPIEKR